MSSHEQSIKELILEAETTVNIDTLKQLSQNVNMNVRRAVARNRHITAEIANNLCADPVLNVSYMAAKNDKSNSQRIFDEKELTPCISCKKPDSTVSCVNCENKNLHKF